MMYVAPVIALNETIDSMDMDVPHAVPHAPLSYSQFDCQRFVDAVRRCPQPRPSLSGNLEERIAQADCVMALFDRR